MGPIYQGSRGIHCKFDKRISRRSWSYLSERRISTPHTPREFIRYHELPLRKSNSTGHFAASVDVAISVLSRNPRNRRDYALPYYSVLSDATDSPALKRICAQMLLRRASRIFQSYTLGHLKRVNGLSFQGSLVRAATLAVWLHTESISCGRMDIF